MTNQIDNIKRQREISLLHWEELWREAFLGTTIRGPLILEGYEEVAGQLSFPGIGEALEIEVWDLQWIKPWGEPRAMSPDGLWWRVMWNEVKILNHREERKQS